jgi:hypothetical protein
MRSNSKCNNFFELIHIDSRSRADPSAQYKYVLPAGLEARGWGAVLFGTAKAMPFQNGKFVDRF